MYDLCGASLIHVRVRTCSHVRLLDKRMYKVVAEIDTISMFVCVAKSPTVTFKAQLSEVTTLL